MDGTPITFFVNTGVGAPDGRVVSWPTVMAAGEPTAPLRVSYFPAGPPILGVGGGTVAPFLNLPLTLL